MAAGPLAAARGKPLAAARGKPLRILIVSPLFVPRGNAEAISGANFALALLEAGADLAVLSDAIRVFEAGTPRDESGLWRPLRGIAEVLESRIGAATLVHDVRYRLYGGSASWVHAVVRRARALHREKPFDLVCSRSLPRSAHVAGYWCSRALDVPWAANINDPWDIRFILANKGGRLPLLHRLTSDYWLHKTLKEASLLTFPCPRLRDYTARIAGVEPRGVVVPHAGRAACPERQREAEGKPGNGTFELVHAGAFGSMVGRSAEVLVKGLGEFLARRPEARPVTRLTLIGPKDDPFREWVTGSDIEKNVASSGWVPYEEALRRIAGASVCILVEPDQEEGVCLSLKLVDYLVARKPVIALNPRIGTVADMLGDPGIARVDPTDARGFAKAVEDHYDAWRSGALRARRPSEELVRSFQSKEVARNFLALSERACARTRPALRRSFPR